ncbi:hypothetical protein PIROE2DRAFT_65402 [Piromyces sp. E2]|nr:hypothetical protein PIROE2DRAFT_65402 [Piromyces sp. E2]|eukprot:OUM56707.1 hypothetical protein PIROE2DRAFT_65402 [Piromyces sp. E2]
MEKEKTTSKKDKPAPERKLPACDNCYKYKRKCDRNFPTCSTCARNQRVCVYSRRRVRSLLVQSSSLTLEERLAHIESLLSISQKNVIQNREAILSNLTSLANGASTTSIGITESPKKEKRPADYDFQDWLKYLNEKFKEIPSPVTPENFTVFRSTSNLHMLWNWNQMHLHRPIFCNCNDDNCTICGDTDKKGKKNSKSNNSNEINNQNESESQQSQESLLTGNNNIDFINQPQINNTFKDPMNMRQLDIASIINNDEINNTSQDKSVNLIWPTTDSFKICEIMAANISSLLSTYLMLNPLLDHFNPLFIEAVYESTVNHILVLLYPPEDYPKEKLEHTFKLIKLNQLVITRLSNIWPYARKYKDSIENLITSSDIYSVYAKNE